MPTEIDQALTHHQAGRLDQAEAAYWEILTHEPENPDALHLLGVLCHQRGDHEKAKARRGAARARATRGGNCGLSRSPATASGFRRGVQ
jgi:Flp pilus assembly protein TadD